jgi:hypothetical protein
VTSTGTSCQRSSEVLALATPGISLRSAGSADRRKAWLGPAAESIVAQEQDRSQEESHDRLRAPGY